MVCHQTVNLEQNFCLVSRSCKGSNCLGLQANKVRILNSPLVLGVLNVMLPDTPPHVIDIRQEGGTGDRRWYFSDGHSEFVPCGHRPETRYLRDCGKFSGYYSPEPARYTRGPDPTEQVVYLNRSQRRALRFGKKPGRRRH
jgi:hypothetical protein